SDELKATIPLEEGRTYIDQARNERDPNQKQKQLETAKAKLDEFIAGNANHDSVGAAQMQLGTLMVERGAMTYASAMRPTAGDAKEGLLKQSREYFADAKKIFDDAEARFTAEYEKHP